MRQLSHGGMSFVENQSVDVVDQVGEADLHLSAVQADGADEQPHQVLLLGKDVLNTGTHGKAFHISQPLSALLRYAVSVQTPDAMLLRVTTSRRTRPSKRAPSVTLPFQMKP